MSFPVEMIAQAVEEFDAEYRRAFPRGGDEDDHHSATAAGVEAVIVFVERTACEENARLRKEVDGLRPLASAYLNPPFHPYSKHIATPTHWQQPDQPEGDNA